MTLLLYASLSLTRAPEEAQGPSAPQTRRAQPRGATAAGRQSNPLAAYLLPPSGAAMEADHQAGAAAAPQQPATQHGAPGGLGDPQDDAAMQALAGGGQPGGGGGDGALVGVKRQAPGDPGELASCSKLQRQAGVHSSGAAAFSPCRELAAPLPLLPHFSTFQARPPPLRCPSSPGRW